jgi:energy-coupling factor transport system ATP-binding protein
MAKAKSPIFRLEQAAVAYHTPPHIVTVLEHIDLTVHEGEWICLLGRNGSGKSTLARILAGLCPLSSGECYSYVNGRVQMVFQNPEAQVIGETVYEDICFGLENAAADPSSMAAAASSVLKLVGLDVPVQRPTRELSGGQKQLLAIAACLALDPEVLIFDEATSMLDPLSRKRVLEAVRALHRNGKTIVWVTQLLEEVDRADRVIVLEDKGIRFDGDGQAFFYDDKAPSGPSVCDRLGFAPPFPVQVAKRLVKQGHKLPFLPVTPHEVSKAVKRLCLS